MFPPKNRKAVLFGVVLVLAVVVVGAVDASRMTNSSVTEVVDPWAVVDVTHYAWGGHAYDIPVEPDTGAHWTVIGEWRFGVYKYYEYASLDVDWNGSGWDISNANTTTNITDFAVCDGAACGSQQDSHGYGYRLQAFANQTASTIYNLYSVTFSVSSVDDGTTLTGTPCDYDTAVSAPAPYVWAAVDYGTFESAQSCNNTGTSLTIPYE